MVNHDLLNLGKFRVVGQDDVLDLRSGLQLVSSAQRLQMIGLLKSRIEVRREALAILAQLHTLSRERLEDRTAGVGRELKASTTVELINRAQQGHVSLAHQISEVHLAHAGALGHRQYEGEVGFR